MKISYQIFRFVLKFEKKVNVDIYPSFLLRSILGKELKTLGCIFMDRSTCEDCPINDRCAYSYIFESIISKDNDIIKGRNRIPHPFIIKSDIDNMIKGCGILFLPLIISLSKEGTEFRIPLS